MDFGSTTPYETVLGSTDSDTGIRMMSVDIANVVHSCMHDVVESGTAMRACKAFDTTVTISGKTGTGDHRQRAFDKNGNQIGEQPISMAGTFVFVIGDRFFGTINVAVLGPQASQFDFTSSYPV